MIRSLEKRLKSLQQQTGDTKTHYVWVHADETKEQALAAKGITPAPDDKIVYIISQIPARHHGGS